MKGGLEERGWPLRTEEREVLVEVELEVEVEVEVEEDLGVYPGSVGARMRTGVCLGEDAAGRGGTKELPVGRESLMSREGGTCGFWYPGLAMVSEIFA